MSTSTQFEKELQRMLDRAWVLDPIGFDRDSIKMLTYPGVSPADGALMWIAGVVWHYYRTTAFKKTDLYGYSPKVLKIWDLGFDPCGTSRKVDLDLEFEVDEKGKKKVVKVVVTPVSDTVYSTSLIEWLGGSGYPVWVLWAKTTNKGHEWRFVFYSHASNPPHPSLIR